VRGEVNKTMLQFICTLFIYQNLNVAMVGAQNCSFKKWELIHIGGRCQTIPNYQISK